jgi:hypothetical protein
MLISFMVQFFEIDQAQARRQLLLPMSARQGGGPRQELHDIRSEISTAIAAPLLINTKAEENSKTPLSPRECGLKDRRRQQFSIDAIDLTQSSTSS